MFFFPLSLKKKRVGFRNVLTSGLIARAYMRLEIVQSNSMRHGEVERERELSCFLLGDGATPEGDGRKTRQTIKEEERANAV